MEIKLGKKNRIRLDEQDFAYLKENKILIQNFPVTDQLRIELTIALSEPGMDSEVSSHAEKLRFNLAENDFYLLNEKEYRKRGILLGTYSIQLDAWSGEKREHLGLD